MLLKDNFLEKQKIINNAKQILKTEFIGLDTIIDEVISNVSSWYVLSDIQERPLVINLWGLTGVGKTSLVDRLVDLLDYKDKFFKFDLGAKKDRFSFSNSFDEMCESKDTSPVIIALDEFHNSRTVSGPFRQENDEDHNRKIWELVDSGIVQYVDWKFGLWDFYYYIETLENLLEYGVVVEKGLVISGVKKYLKEFDLDLGEINMQFISEEKYEKIIEFAGKELNINLKSDLRKILLSLNGSGSISFLKKVVKIAKRPVEKNFSKALIFVLGNLDEAYTMSSNFSADIDADEFHNQSLKINITDKKNALKQRFRDEQIARLGNIHIIYPALNRAAYLKIIKNELIKISNNLKKLTKIKIAFDETIVNLIYKEGVYPTQGVRPILTTINHLIKSKLTFFLSEILIKNIDPTLLKFSMHNNLLICRYLSNKTVLYEKDIKIITLLEDMRKSRFDDSQAITAVHESGHAVLLACLLQIIPDVIYSITTNSQISGFVYSKFKWEYISRKELIPRLAVFLGGYVAEEMIFGKEYLTTGASSDIEKATTFLSSMYKDSGMGSLPISYSIPSSGINDSYHNYEPIEEEIKNTLEQALDLARKTLLKEKVLLLKMSDYLSDNRMIKKEEIEAMVNKNVFVQINFIKNGDLLFYRNHLKNMVSDCAIKTESELSSKVCLNKENIINNH